MLACPAKDVQQGFLVQICEPANATNTKTFRKAAHDLTDLFKVCPNVFQRLTFGKSFAATDAAETLNDTVFIAIIGEMFDFAGAAVTVQLAFLGKES